jgi:transposase
MAISLTEFRQELKPGLYDDLEPRIHLAVAKAFQEFKEREAARIFNESVLQIEEERHIYMDWE